ncbi:MAG TPA: hypothetical protein VE090_00290 [Methylomirabilota bacterium]|nr:hypothetical protein [Methylomirabilota bacterium]
MIEVNPLRILVSFPHQTNQEGSLLVIGPPKPRWVNLHEEKMVKSYGLVKHTDANVVFHAGKIKDTGKPLLKVLDANDLSVRDTYALDTRDPHSLCVVEDNLFIVATGTDEVRAVPLTDPGKKSEVVYRVPDSNGSADTYHLNSIVTTPDGRTLVSGFGPREGQKWYTAQNGFVADVLTSEKLIEGIYHPHTLFVAGSDILICESSRSKVHNLNRKTVWEGNLYTRGLAYDNQDNLLIGESTGVMHESQKGTIRNAEDEGTIVGEAMIYRYNKNTGKTTVMQKLSAYGPEIYDIVTL